MAGLGLADVLVLLPLLFLVNVAVPVIVVVLAVRWAVAREIKGAMISSKFCGECVQRIPNIGSFCLFCGQRRAFKAGPEEN